MNTAVLIPAFEPNEKLMDLIHKLVDLPFRCIFVVDDGSSEQCAVIFTEIDKLPNCRVIRHLQNKGKGAALKTGFQALLKLKQPVSGCVTADADGQHLPDDILRVAKVLEENPDALILGSRDFSASCVPQHNKMGNHITRSVFKFMTGTSLRDTQTGLRGIPAKLMEQFADLPGERYEFEMNMLMQGAKSGIPIVELNIRTVYIEKNRSSHFRPFKDSARIYSQIFKFAFSSLVCSAIDIGAFALLIGLLPASAYKLLAATAIARICSSSVNFCLNKNMVFKETGGAAAQAAKYYVLCAAQMLCSWLLLQSLTLLELGNVVLLKILGDTSLFFLSYVIQRKFVFGRKYHAKSI